jgi:DNA-binding transcriptional LysR family regulator
MDSRLNHAVAVAHSGTFTAAAKKVGVTQSAITRSIADLEREIGYPIFVRTARGAILTEHGRDFVERAQKVLEDAKELLLKPRGDEDHYAGILHVGVCPASIEFLLTDAVEELLRRYPSIKVNISGSTFERTVQQLRSGAIDLAVGYEAAFADWPDLRRHDIPFETQNVLFVRRGHPLSQIARPTAADLVQYDFVSPSDSRPYGATLRSLFEDQGIDWRKKLHTVDFFPMVKRIVASSDSVGVVFRNFVDKSASFREQFERVESDALDIEKGSMCCAYRSRWEIRPAVRAFISILRGSQI